MVSNPSAQRFNASSHSLDNIAPYCVRCNSSCKLKNDIISCCLEKYIYISFTLEEQNDIMNGVLDVFEANDMIKN